MNKWNNAGAVLREGRLQQLPGAVSLIFPFQCWGCEQCHGASRDAGSRKSLPCLQTNLPELRGFDLQGAVLS